MHIPTLDEIKDLSRHEAQGLVTLTLPVVDPQQDRIRFKTLLSRARDHLESMPLSQDEIRSRLEPAEELLEATWTLEGRGLAVLLGPDSHHVWRVPVELSEQVTVADRWHITELVPMLQESKFYLLAVELGGWRLLACDAWQCEQLDVPDAPADIDEATATTVDPVPGGSSHSMRMKKGAGKGAGTRVETQGFGHEHRKSNDAQQYFRMLWSAVQDALPDQPQVVISCDEQWSHLLRETAPVKVHEGKLDNPKGRDDGSLHQAAVKLLREELPSHLDALRKAQSDGRCAMEPSHVVAAAHAGAIETLLYKRQVTVPGEVDRDQGTAETLDEPRAGAVDLVDEAIRTTLLHGGTPRCVEHLPGNKAMAAILSWPLPADSLKRPGAAS